MLEGEADGGSLEVAARDMLGSCCGCCACLLQTSLPCLRLFPNRLVDQVCLRRPGKSGDACSGDPECDADTRPYGMWTA